MVVLPIIKIYLQDFVKSYFATFYCVACSLMGNRQNLPFLHHSCWAFLFLDPLPAGGNDDCGLRAFDLNCTGWPTVHLTTQTLWGEGRTWGDFHRNTTDKFHKTQWMSDVYQLGTMKRENIIFVEYLADSPKSSNLPKKACMYVAIPETPNIEF